MSRSTVGVAEDVDEAHAHRHLGRRPAAAARERVAGERQRELAAAAAATPAARRGRRPAVRPRRPSPRRPAPHRDPARHSGAGRIGAGSAPGAGASPPAPAPAPAAAAAAAAAPRPPPARRRRLPPPRPRPAGPERPALTEKPEVLLPRAILPAHGRRRTARPSHQQLPRVAAVHATCARCPNGSPTCFGSKSFMT